MLFDPPVPEVLALTLLSGAVPSGRYQVFRSVEGVLGPWRLSLHVIGASSLVTVSLADGAVWTEIIACTEGPVNGSSLVQTQVSLAPATCATAAVGDGRFTYHVELAAEALHTPAPPADLSGALVVEHRFPGPAEPRTRIVASARERPHYSQPALELLTHHEYPEKALAIRSRSHWSLR
jgi:hypothetical protein